jgi:hypothetical protein
VALIQLLNKAPRRFVPTAEIRLYSYALRPDGAHGATMYEIAATMSTSRSVEGVR